MYDFNKSIQMEEINLQKDLTSYKTSPNDFQTVQYIDGDVDPEPDQGVVLSFRTMSGFGGNNTKRTVDKKSTDQFKSDASMVELNQTLEDTSVNFIPFQNPYIKFE